MCGTEEAPATLFTANIDAKRVSHLTLRVGVAGRRDPLGFLLPAAKGFHRVTLAPSSLARLRVAMESSGYVFPEDEISLEARPALRGERDAHLLLPVAIGLLAADGVVPHDALGEILVCGGLRPDGTVTGVRHAACIASVALMHGIPSVLLSLEAASRVAAVHEKHGRVGVVGVETLREAVEYLSGGTPLLCPPPPTGGGPLMAACPRREGVPVGSHAMPGGLGT